MGNFEKISIAAALIAAGCSSASNNEQGAFSCGPFVDPAAVFNNIKNGQQDFVVELGKAIKLCHDQAPEANRRDNLRPNSLGVRVNSSDGGAVDFIEQFDVNAPSRFDLNRVVGISASVYPKAASSQSVEGPASVAADLLLDQKGYWHGTWTPQDAKKKINVTVDAAGMYVETSTGETRDEKKANFVWGEMAGNLIGLLDKTAPNQPLSRLPDIIVP